MGMHSDRQKLGGESLREAVGIAQALPREQRKLKRCVRGEKQSQEIHVLRGNGEEGAAGD